MRGRRDHRETVKGRYECARYFLTRPKISHGEALLSHVRSRSPQLLGGGGPSPDDCRQDGHHPHRRCH